MKVGIMGGSFDPIHIGHLLMAEQAKDELGLDKILFIPTGNPPHKDTDRMTDASKRFEMVKLAIGDNHDFLISDIESKSSSVSYTVKTLETLKSHNSQWDLYFIMGSDSFLSLNTWRNYEKILRDYKVIVAKRPNYKNEMVYNISEEFKKEYDAQIDILRSPIVDISSTSIRDKVRAGESIRYMLPEAVREYILKLNLY